MIPVPNDIQALIFDCDGTLADSMPLHLEAWCELFKEHGCDCPLNFLDARKGAPVLDIVRDYNRIFGTTIDPVLFAEEKERRFQDKMPLLKPLKPVLDTALKYYQKLPMAVVSGSPLSSVLPSLRVIGASHLFPVIVTMDDGLAPKPSPAMFLAAAEKLGVSPEFCQVFEDGDYGLEGARKARMLATDIRPFQTNQ